MTADMREIIDDCHDWEESFRVRNIDKTILAALKDFDWGEDIEEKEIYWLNYGTAEKQGQKVDKNLTTNIVRIVTSRLSS
jgi:hypothetical protein